MALVNPELALEKINQLEDKFLQEQQPIIYIQHIKNSPNADFFGIGTEGAQLHSKLKNNEHSIVIEKHFPNSFYETQLLESLQKLEIEQLVITGMMTHMCVDSTTRAARELGYQPIVIADATATKNLEFQGKEVSAQQVQISFLSALQNFAQIQATHTFLW